MSRLWFLPDRAAAFVHCLGLFLQGETVSDMFCRGSSGLIWTVKTLVISCSLDSARSLSISSERSVSSLEVSNDDVRCDDYDFTSHCVHVFLSLHSKYFHRRWLRLSVSLYSDVLFAQWDDRTFSRTSAKSSLLRKKRYTSKSLLRSVLVVLGRESLRVLLSCRIILSLFLSQDIQLSRRDDVFRGSVQVDTTTSIDITNMTSELRTDDSLVVLLIVLGICVSQNTLFLESGSRLIPYLVSPRMDYMTLSITALSERNLVLRVHMTTTLIVNELTWSFRFRYVECPLSPQIWDDDGLTRACQVKWCWRRRFNSLRSQIRLQSPYRVQILSMSSSQWWLTWFMNEVSASDDKTL